MTKQEFVNAVAENHTNLSKAEVERVLSTGFDTITQSLAKGEKVVWAGFGTFEIANRAERMGRNPSTGAALKIAASKGVKFRASSKLKSQL